MPIPAYRNARRSLGPEFGGSPRPPSCYDAFGIVHCHAEAKWADPVLQVVRNKVVGSAELESATSCVSSRRSNQLSYEPWCGPLLILNHFRNF